MNTDFMKGTAIGMLVMLLLALIYARIFAHDEEAKVMQAAEIIAAYKEGRKDALKTNTVNWELEQACLSLWAGKQ